MASARWNKKSDGVRSALEKAVARKNTMPGYLNRVAYRQYQDAQITRFETENKSETGQWDALTTQYAARKLVEFHDFPGGGRALMVATSRLVMAATGQGEGALKVISGSKLTVGIDDGAIPYGKYAAGLRPVMEFGDDTTIRIVHGAIAWVMEGRE